MSGICGVLALDGSDVSRTDLDAMLRRLERRGPDGTHQSHGRSVALGHTLLATTPEALVEVLPLTDPESGCTITADCRLDNREDLIAELGVEGRGPVIGNGELILRAYLQWGEDCPGRLLGDFAFAVWDPREAKLFCARDHMGMRQLIYHYRAGERFVFATEAEAALAHGGVPRRINTARIADYLDDLEGRDLISTFFEGVFRLPPAHCLTVTMHGLSIRRYWELRPGPALVLDSDQAYADAFLDVFTDAVRCRLRTAGHVGAMLSGGMDSTSVVAVAARLLGADGKAPLTTLSAVGPDPSDCIETRSIATALTMPGLAPLRIDHADLLAIEADLRGSTDDIGEPFDGHMTLIRALYLSAHRDGLKVILDGAGGDVALTASATIVAQLRQGRFSDAWREAQGEKRFWDGAHPMRVLLEAGWAAFVPGPVRRLRHELQSRLATAAIGKPGSMARHFARASRRPVRWREFRRHMGFVHRPDAEHRARTITHPNLTVGRERYDREAGRHGIEPRDPFLDIRLLQFCLSLPSGQLQRDGWPKLVLRRAMAGMVPDEIIWRRGKDHLGWRFTQALFAAWPGWTQRLLAGRHRLEPFIADIDSVVTRYLERGDADDFPLLTRAYWLEIWLKRIELMLVEVDTEAIGA